MTNLRRIIVIAAAVLFLSLTTSPVAAQGPTSYESTVTVTNVSSTAGTVNLVFYNPDGSVADDSINDPIGALETKFYTTFPVSSGFEGSLVISSDVPLASASTIIGKDSSGNPMNYASYVGESSGSGTVYLPLLMDENYGFNTYFSVQNTGENPANIAIDYSDGLAVSAISGLQRGAAKIIDNQAENHPDVKFAAKLTATGADIAAVVVEWSSGRFGESLFAYNGFAANQGTTDPVIPMVNQNNYGYWTSIPIQNLGTKDTVVTMTYAPTKAGTACEETLTIPAGGWAEFGAFAHVFSPQTPGTTCNLKEKFVGAAVVTNNSENQPLIGLMNQSTTERTNYEKAGALKTMNPALATPKIAFPESYQWFGSESWWSSITIVNVSGSTLPANSITCRAIGNAGSTSIDQTWKNPAPVADGKGWITDLFRGWGPLPDGFLGGIICESSGNILGTLNNLGDSLPENMDSYTLYEGINIAP